MKTTTDSNIPLRGPLKFRYKRRIYTDYPSNAGTVEYGGIAADDMPVKVLVCHGSKSLASGAGPGEWGCRASTAEM